MYQGERFNSISHLVAAVLALVGLGALLSVSIEQQRPTMIVGFSIFGFTLVLLYTMSTLYHSFHPPRLKNLFRKFDHVSIYLLIAGTYTPVLLVSLGARQSLPLLAAIWGLAIIGLMLDLFNKRRMILIQVSICLLLGWSCVLQWGALNDALPSAGMAWLLAGGIVYSIGVIFYLLDKAKLLPHAHGVWHLFSMGGSVCHYVAVISYVR